MNGKSKGSSWEREICKFLTKWVSGTEKPYIFWRSPSSGAFVTNKVSDEIGGDITSLLPEGKFFTDKLSCEAKVGYDDVDILKMFKDSKNNVLEGFWKQCIRDARLTSKYGMLIYKKTNYPAIVGIEEDVYKKFIKQKLELPKSLTIDFSNDLPKLMMFNFIDLFNIIKPINIKKL